eukprot:1323939-Rhodomonas_salina.1
MRYTVKPSTRRSSPAYVRQLYQIRMPVPRMLQGIRGPIAPYAVPVPDMDQHVVSFAMTVPYHTK